MQSNTTKEAENNSQNNNSIASKFGIPTGGNQPLGKKEKEQLVNKMKDQVPVVLLNQWLDIKPEKTGFAKRENCLANADEYSVYSDETMSQALSIKGASMKGMPKLHQRKSILVPNGSPLKSNFEKAKSNSSRRMTMMNNDIIGGINRMSEVIKEVDDMSDTSDDMERSSVNKSTFSPDRLKAHDKDGSVPRGSENHTTEARSKFRKSTINEEEVHLQESTKELPLPHAFNSPLIQEKREVLDSNILMHKKENSA